MHIRIEEHVRLQALDFAFRQSAGVYSVFPLLTGIQLQESVFEVTKMEYCKSHPARWIAGHGAHFLHGPDSVILTRKLLVVIKGNLLHTLRLFDVPLR